MAVAGFVFCGGVTAVRIVLGLAAYAVWRDITAFSSHTQKVFAHLYFYVVLLVDKLGGFYVVPAAYAIPGLFGFRYLDALGEPWGV